MTLRLMMLHADNLHNENIKKAILRLLRQPFFSEGKEQSKEIVKHHFRFSLEYLVNEAFLDPETCLPCDFAGLAAHLYYMEPKNFVFIHLLRKKAFDEIACKKDYNTAIKILCVILGTGARGDHIRDLPDSVNLAFEEFNSTVFKIYQLYLSCYTKVCLLEK